MTQPRPALVEGLTGVGLSRDRKGGRPESGRGIGNTKKGKMG